jgi:hypothetical protein
VEYPVFPWVWGGVGAGAGTGFRFGEGVVGGGDGGGVGCEGFGEEGMEWEGEYGCRLLVGGGKAGQGVRVGELGLGG